MYETGSILLKPMPMIIHSPIHPHLTPPHKHSHLTPRPLTLHTHTHTHISPSLPIQHAFKWFDSGMTDLEHETQVLMFNTRVLKVDPDKLDQPGYHCLRNFFETINLYEKKLKRLSSSYHSLVRLSIVPVRIVTYASLICPPRL